MLKYASLIINVPVKQSFTYTFDDDKLTVKVGTRVTVDFGRRTVTGFVTEITDNEPTVTYQLKEIKTSVDEEPIFNSLQVNLALWMEKFYLCSRGEALSAMIPNAKKDPRTAGFNYEDEFANSKVNLTEDQQKAVDEILYSGKKNFYLYGITGSGKTEVFLTVAQKIIESGKQVIYLVPEITLSHQLANIVNARFDKKVAILHSGLTNAQRFKENKRIINDEVSLIIGARSAIFAPTNNLGLIIIDEEHESSYKSDSSPRYHARQIAQRLCSETGATLLMGSATPSLESIYMAKDPTKLQMIKLTKRVSGGKLPTVRTINMLGEKNILSAELISAINSTLSEKKQVILFLNRRGFNYNFHCNSCGFELSCPHCSVNLTYHKNKSAYICHYCGYQTKKPQSCPQCNSLDVSHYGFGTEKIEEEVRATFPNAIVSRLDTDVAQKKGVTKQTIDDFREGKIDILLGTQMVAKGLNFPHLKLVGIVLADSTLSIPDFRSSERTFDLIVQVSGRSGRYDDTGLVLVQTLKPEAPAIHFAIKNQCQEFYDYELENRKLTAFPPFTRMVQLVFRGKDLQKVIEHSEYVGEVFNQALSSYKKEGELFEIIGPCECPISKIALNYRHQILIRSTNPARLHSLTSKVLSSIKSNSKVYVEVDFDPLSLL